ncbi:MAG: aldehyde dehydrogenase family protein [Thermodesulfobacteriota bacterium]
MAPKKHPYYLANEPIFANADLPVFDKFSGNLAYEVAMADEAAIHQAIDRAVEAEGAMAALPPYRRQAVLEHCVERFSQRAEELAKALCVEAGKPIRDSRGEVERLIETFKIAAEEAVRVPGDFENLGRSPRTSGYLALTKQVPVGACSFISPFNFPLNLAAHKVAPAIASGCPFLLKPASLTPIGALIIGEVLAETDLPKGAFSILPCHREGARLFSEDERLKLLSFTGSPEVGWALKERAGKKRVVLELGGNAACIVDRDADIAQAVERIIIGAFYQSGQSCIGIQRILVHQEIYAEFKEKMLFATRALISGDPREEKTFIGPMISEREAIRLTEWLAEAKEGGGRILCGGERDGAMLTATLVENAPRSCRLNQEEAFGPVATLSPFSDFNQALTQVNDSRFGLQTGIFTRDIQHALTAWDQLEVGGVIIGDIPSWRADQMPYGGVKDSGLGREGIKNAMADMSEPRIMVIRQQPG